MEQERQVIETNKNNFVPVIIKTHKDKNGGHPHVVLGDIDNKHVSVGLTTKASKGKNHPNYKLKHNPLNDGKTSYMRKQGTVDGKNVYFRPRYCLMDREDFGVAKKIGNKALEKYKRE